MTPRKIQYWVIPPKANGEFVACMENVLENYAQPYDSQFAVHRVDEQPDQLLTGTRGAEAKKVILVCDTLNTLTIGAFYEAFPAEQARELVRRLDFRYTLKHGS